MVVLFEGNLTDLSNKRNWSIWYAISWQIENTRNWICKGLKNAVGTFNVRYICVMIGSVLNNGGDSSQMW